MAAPNPFVPDPIEQFHTCPVCGGKMELVYNRHNQQVSVCVDCHVGVTIPASAWEIARRKHEHKFPKRTE